jgi:hypothetical protein
VNEKAFRLDFVIAIAALLVSAFTSITLLYQTHVISQQYAATIWPYLGISSSYSPQGVSIQVENDGLGPALIDSAQLMLDGKPVSSWGAFLGDLKAVPDLKRAKVAVTASSFGRSTTIRPGESQLLFAAKYTTTINPHVLLTHRVGIRLCYCSINSSCWNLVATPGKDSRRVPEPVSNCTENAMISSDLTY